MPLYDIKCTNDSCDYCDVWVKYISDYVKDIQTVKCPKCNSNLTQDYTNSNPIVCQGVSGYSKIKPSILRAESDALRENDYLAKKAKTDRNYIRRADETKRMEDSGR